MADTLSGLESQRFGIQQQISRLGDMRAGYHDYGWALR
jgi:hypothetical protein